MFINARHRQDPRHPGEVTLVLAHCNAGALPTNALRPDGAVHVEESLRVWSRHQHAVVWGNLHADPRAAPSENFTLCTYLVPQLFWHHTARRGGRLEMCPMYRW
jgi:hypothetical protein